jgi:phosphoglycolate phosphatase
MPAIRHVIWDFNGTLLDDVDACVETVNTILAEHARPALTREDYLARFGFPVRAFYAELGLDLDAAGFEALSRTYIERYLTRLDGVWPRPDALGAMVALADRGVGQSVLSAMESRLLEDLLGRMKLRHHVAHVRGLDDFHAGSKTALGVGLARELGLAPESLLLVGDTLHDFEVAREIGCACVLYARGHQAPHRLRASGAPVVESLVDVIEHVAR